MSVCACVHSNEYIHGENRGQAQVLFLRHQNLILFCCFKAGLRWAVWLPVKPRDRLACLSRLGPNAHVSLCVGSRNYTQLFLLARWTWAAESPLQPASAVGLNPLKSRSRELHTQTTELQKVDLLKVDISFQLTGYAWPLACKNSVMEKESVVPIRPLNIGRRPQSLGPGDGVPDRHSKTAYPNTKNGGCDSVVFLPSRY